MKKLLLTSILAFLTGFLAAQNYIVLKGNVKETQSGTPLPGCDVFLSGLNNGTVTDSLGNFELKVPATRSWQYLIISYVGYPRYSIKISEIPQSGIEFTLKKETKLLNEVVIHATKPLGGIEISGLPENYWDADPDFIRSSIELNQSTEESIMLADLNRDNR